MGRSNKAARSRNQRGRLPRGERGVPPSSRPRDPAVPKIPIEKMVIPDGQCMAFGRRGKPKASFATKEKAQKALEQAQQLRRRTGSGQIEKRFYACPEGGCGGYHLTSRETYQERR